MRRAQPLNVRARKTLPLLIQLRTNRFTGNIDVMGQSETLGRGQQQPVAPSGYPDAFL
jgi:hypothetical protein